MLAVKEAKRIRIKNRPKEALQMLRRAGAVHHADDTWTVDVTRNNHITSTIRVDLKYRLGMFEEVSSSRAKQDTAS